MFNQDTLIFYSLERGRRGGGPEKSRYIEQGNLRLGRGHLRAVLSNRTVHDGDDPCQDAIATVDPLGVHCTGDLTTIATHALCSSNKSLHLLYSQPLTSSGTRTGCLLYTTVLWGVGTTNTQSCLALPRLVPSQVLEL